jgi:hypothetical protein
LACCAASCPFGFADPLAGGAEWAEAASAALAGGSNPAAGQACVGRIPACIPAMPAENAPAISRDTVASHSGSLAIDANWSCHRSR